MHEEPSRPTTPPPPAAPAAVAATSAAPEEIPEQAGAQTAAAAPSTRGEIESAILEAGHNAEAAARQLGSKLDETLLNNETGREVKQKVGSFWNRIKEKIQ